MSGQAQVTDAILPAFTGIDRVRTSHGDMKLGPWNGISGRLTLTPGGGRVYRRPDAGAERLNWEAGGIPARPQAL